LFSPDNILKTKKSNMATKNYRIEKMCLIHLQPGFCFLW